jgi:protein-arginine kinase activator protein McsA
MVKKIINLTKDNEGGSCLTCGAKEATIKMKIQRINPEDNITSFHICDECVAKMQQDIQKICE